MTRKSKARYGLKRTYKLNPTVKALRNALMASVMAASIAPSVAVAAPPQYHVPINFQGFGAQIVNNFGDVSANAQNIGAAIVAISQDNNAAVYNEGILSVIVDAGLYNYYGDSALAAGIYVASLGDSTVYNTGGATVIANAINSGDAQAYGIAVGANYSNVGGIADVHNEGDLTVSANAQAGNANASGIYVQAFGDVSTYNSGDISISAYSVYGDVNANGLLADSDDGDVYVYNSGILTISAESVYGSASATGISVEAYDLASVVNVGDITVSASVSGIANIYTSTDTTANAYGIQALSDDFVSVNNSGNITLSVSNDLYLGTSTAMGIDVDGYNGATITNSGDIVITASSGGGAIAYGVYPGYDICGYFFCYITDAGTIDTVGIKAESDFGVTTINNSGDITITDLNPDGGFLGNLDSGDYLKGIQAFNNMGDVVVTNSGDIVLEGGKWDFGILAQTGTTIGTKSTYIYDYGYGNYGYYDLPYAFGGGDVSVVNTGNITITAGVTHPDGWLNYRASIGIAATTDVCGTNYYWLDDSTCGGDVSVVNTGELNITNTGSGGAVGIAAYASFLSSGDVYVGNSGDMNINGTEFATGISAKTDTGDAYVKNFGNLTLNTDASDREGRAVGIDAFSEEGAATVLNAGDIVSNGDISAGGIRAGSLVGDVMIANTGDIYAHSSLYYTFYSYYQGGYYALGGNAFGLRASTLTGIGSVQNSGDVDVYGVINAYGIINNSRYSSVYTLNTGDITVTNGDNDFAGNVYGIITQGSGFDEYYFGYNDGFTTVLNSGDITANGTELAVGIKATQGYGAVTIQNSGAIVVDSANRASRGIETTNAYGTTNILNIGDITVTAPGSAVAISAYSSGYGQQYYYGDIYIGNGGDLTASSEYSRATAIEAQSTYGSIEVRTYGNIEATSYTRAFGVDARTIYGDIQIVNYADVSAVGDTEFAAGLRAQTNYGDVAFYNGGSVSASAYSLAQGLVALSYYGNAIIFNSGDVTATSSDGYSQAVALRSGYSEGVSFLLNSNSGQITAGSGDYAVAISATGGDAIIYNEGMIAGSIITDNGYDVIANKYGGQIVLTDDVINLYGGYDEIYNDEYSTISMDNSTIDFGYGESLFVNDGELIVNGSNNLIDMGYSEGGRHLFLNYGNSIHMEDGDTDDALTIIGDFAGDGSIFVDVDGQSLSSDRLYIDGDVYAGTENVVDVNLLSIPNASDIVDGTTIPIVTVSGANAAGNFVLGDVAYQNNTLFTVDFDLVRETPTTDFSLAFEVTGLTTAGVMLSTISPAVQNLWFSSLGTMYQRQGAERNFNAETGKAEANGAAGAWVRLYGTNGSMSPDANRSNFGSEGSQDFALNTSGVEAGFGYSFNSAWTVGLLGGINKGDFNPTAGGKISIDGNTWGGYVTFIPGNGFYADLSYRDISYDGDTNFAGTQVQVDGSASGFSLEMGYGFKLQSGLEIEPQLQYSDLSVDLDDIDYTAGGFELTDGDAAQLRIGTAFRKAFNQDSGVWVPYGALSYIQNYDGSNNYLIGGALEGQVDTSGGSVLLELGTDARYGNFNFNAGVGWQDGGTYNSVLSGQLNVRYTW